MAKITGITKKTENPFVNLYELDRESKTGKRANIMLRQEQRVRRI